MAAVGERGVARGLEYLEKRELSGMADREVVPVNRGVLTEILIVLTFILVVLMMFGVRFGG